VIPGPYRLRLVGLSLALAFVGGLVVSAPGRAEHRAHRSSTACTAGRILAVHRTDRISLATAGCVSGGKAIPTIVRYSYTQLDDGGAQCGSFAGTGRSFTARLAGTFSVEAQFIVAPKDKSSSVPPRSTFAQLTLGHGQLRCEKLDPARPPEVIDMCAYQFNPANTSDTCGSIIRSPNSTYAGAYPSWSSRPIVGGLWSFPSTVGGQTIYAPRFVSPSGRCTQRAQVPLSLHATWMDQPAFSAYWTCTDGLSLIPFVSLFYFAPDAQGLTCSFGFRNLVLGGQFTQFKLPADATDWNGTLDVVWKMVISDKTGPVGYVFADTIISLKGSGTVKACQELAKHSPG
jgi:hypothetical protein